MGRKIKCEIKAVSLQSEESLWKKTNHKACSIIRDCKKESKTRQEKYNHETNTFIWKDVDDFPQNVIIFKKIDTYI